MRHKHNAARRHHIPKMSFKVQNWPAYEAGLRLRGSLTLWIEDAALECWQTIGPSGQARYREAAIQTSVMLRTAFKLALRQTEGLMTSVLTLMGLTPAKARGVKMGRPPKMTPHQVKEALRRRDAGEPMRDIARSYNVSHSTISRLAA
jgi:hypothetical protein